MKISLLYKNTSIIVVVAYSMSLFLIKLNFRTQIVIFLSLNYSWSIKNHLTILYYFSLYKIFSALNEVFGI